LHTFPGRASQSARQHRLTQGMDHGNRYTGKISELANDKMSFANAQNLEAVTSGIFSGSDLPVCSTFSRVVLASVKIRHFGKSGPEIEQAKFGRSIFKKPRIFTKVGTASNKAKRVKFLLRLEKWKSWK